MPWRLMTPKGPSKLVSEQRFRALLADGAREVRFERVTANYKKAEELL